ncbi:MAG TPA: stage V sporulation protein SpoVM [Ruminococcaceae bacterium]|nr:stage V sporulation protein SpoVM [Oscillospiraceae bacterium]HBQ46816.1 stage V sporulation protein SpoVM [Oscillospiraceae bacterium]HBT91014.1 stage V sporulation protein SpoVM [Oscillospiraceae bacterium]HCB91757.1 stage V sporulation protein SpoVM [Oscillospiraceae bacterium]
MKVVVVRSSKFWSFILRRVFGVKREQ